MTNLLLSGYGFGRGGPFLLMDNLSAKPTIRKRLHILNVQFTLRKFEDRFCIGGYNLEIGEFETCPNQAKVSGKYTVCLSCRDKSGFNPAFYNSDYISPKQEIYNQRSHIVYLANFGSGVSKVGIAARTPGRWLEQGARVATIIKHCADAYEARKIEEWTRDWLGIPEAINSKTKRKLISDYDMAEGEREIKALRTGLMKNLDYEIEENEVLSFDEIYMPGNKIDAEITDLTGNDFISGKYLGMVGDILIFEEDGLQFMASIKSFIGFLVSTENKMVRNNYVKSSQQSLF